ncbi:MAG: outer membrane protein assembly factor BamA [Elusimicrobia bacterium]|nr:outer membrane protein assembly factor BamA [Elusimicrobiota bacterium]
MKITSGLITAAVLFAGQEAWSQNENSREVFVSTSVAAVSAEDDEFEKGPWEVAEIAVKGNVNIKPKLISRTGKARIKKIYYSKDINSDIESILNLGSVEKVSVDVSGTAKPVKKKFREITGSSVAARVTYIIEEKPRIKKIILSAGTRKKIKKGKIKFVERKLSVRGIKDEMTLKEKDFFDTLKIKEDLIKLTDKYREKGFLNASVGYDVEFDTAANACVLRINVAQGVKSTVAGVEFIEAKAFPVKKLVKKMKNRPKKIYMPSELETDVENIENFYKNNGYSEFAIQSSSAVFSPDRSKVNIKINLSEGPKHKFGRTVFYGNTLYASGELSEFLEYRRGKIYSQERFDDTLRVLHEKYADKGRIRAQIVPEKIFNESTGELDVSFGITENNPVYVAHIDIEGNKATKTYVFRREVVQKEGEVFSSSKIRRSQEKIFNLGFIDDVRPVINPTSDPDKVDVIFDVAEGKPGMLTAGAGISSKDGLVGTLSLNHLNLFGRAYKTSISWQFGKRVQDYYLSWSAPWIKNKPTSFGIDIFNTRRYRPYGSELSAYTERRSGAKITLGPRFQDDKYHLTTSYTYEKRKIFDVKDVYKDALTEGTSVISSVYVEFARDTRDNIWDPTRGTRLSLGLDFAGGLFQGDLNYYKPSVSYSWNQKLFSIDDYPFVVSVLNRFGFVDRFGSTGSVPVFEKYFLGGGETIRGYNNNGQIGPAEGGKIYDVVNIEFKFPLARERKRTIVQWAFFLDFGNSWTKFRDVRYEFGTGADKLKAGAGFGIRFTTPAFPIRLDWGYGFNHRLGEEKSDIYFTLGNVF